MRVSVAVFLGAMCLGLVMSVAIASPKTETITGKVIDLFCYDVQSGANSGMDHTAVGAAGQEGRECAMSCAKWEGQPVGLLTSDGKLYQLAGDIVGDNNAKIAPHMTHIVSITGVVAEKDGITTLTASDLQMVSK